MQSFYCFYSMWLKIKDAKMICTRRSEASKVIFGMARQALRA